MRVDLLCGGARTQALNHHAGMQYGACAIDQYGTVKVDSLYDTFPSVPDLRYVHDIPVTLSEDILGNVWRINISFPLRFPSEDDKDAEILPIFHQCQDKFSHFRLDVKRNRGARAQKSSLYVFELTLLFYGHYILYVVTA